MAELSALRGYNVKDSKTALPDQSHSVVELDSVAILSRLSHCLWFVLLRFACVQNQQDKRGRNEPKRSVGKGCSTFLLKTYREASQILKLK